MAFNNCGRAYPVDVAVITIVDVELAAFHELFGKPNRIHKFAGDTYELYDLEGESTCCTMVHANVGKMGNVLAASTMSRLLARFRPRVAFLVGIAAGNEEKVRISDVIVGESIYYYELARKEESDNRPRIRILEADPNLVKFADATLREYGLGNNFVSAIQPPILRKLSAQANPVRKLNTSVARKAVIASGEKLLADGATIPALATTGHEKIFAADMEAYGFAVACEGHQKVPWLPIRGISDFGNPKKAESDPQFESSLAACLVFSVMIDAMLKAPNPLRGYPHAPDLVEVEQEAKIENPPHGIHELNHFFDEDQYEVVEQALRRNSWIFGFLSTSLGHSHGRYHFGHAYFLALLSSLLRQSDRIGLVISDTPNTKREHSNKWHVELSYLRQIWESLSPNIQVLRATHHIEEADRELFERAHVLMHNWKILFDSNSLSQPQKQTLKDWRCGGLSVEVSSDFTNYIRNDIIHGFENDITDEQVLAITYLLTKRDFQWFEVTWFINFTSALANNFRAFSESPILIIESKKNRYAWEAMSLLAKSLSLPFPHRAYFNNFPDITGTAPMMSNQHTSIISLSSSIPDLDPKVLNAMAALISPTSDASANSVIHSYQTWAAALLQQQAI